MKKAFAGFIVGVAIGIALMTLSLIYEVRLYEKQLSTKDSLIVTLTQQNEWFSKIIKKGTYSHE